MFKIGTLADWFDLGLLEGIRESERCGAEGVQLYAADEMDPRTITAAEKKALRQVLGDCHQTVAAVCGELGGYGLEKAEDNADKIAYLKQVIDLGCELDCQVVTTHIGVIPADQSLPRYRVMLEAMQELGAYAAARGSALAIETGPERIETLASFVDACGAGVAVNYDPANIVMVTGVDHVEGVHIAGHRIVHTHAKDGVNIAPVEAEAFYHGFAEGGLEWSRTLDTILKETPLGEGDVCWREYLKALTDVGYKGFLTIEREVVDGSEDIRAAVRYLRELIDTL